jgi:hypothetical protein
VLTQVLLKSAAAYTESCRDLFYGEEGSRVAGLFVWHRVVAILNIWRPKGGTY